jgi:hypothetical protein
MAVIFNHFSAGRHRPKRHRGFLKFEYRSGFAGWCGRKERQRLIPQTLDRPQRLASSEVERGLHSVSLGDLNERSGRNAGAPPKIVDRGEWVVGSGGDAGCGIGIGEAAHHAKAKPNGEAAVSVGWLADAGLQGGAGGLTFRPAALADDQGDRHPMIGHDRVRHADHGNRNDKQEPPAPRGWGGR